MTDEELLQIADETGILTDEERAVLASPRPGGKRNKAFWETHPEERIRQRAVAKLQIARGKWGGSRTKVGKRPAYEIAAARAAVYGEQIARELVTLATDKTSKPSERLAAIKTLFDMELKVRSEQRNDEDHLLKLTGDDLNQELMKLLRDLTGSKELDKYVDSTSEDITDAIEEGHNVGNEAHAEITT